jgi:uncharacterized protein involved in exopolysaccharide biosynthesis
VLHLHFLGLTEQRLTDLRRQRADFVEAMSDSEKISVTAALEPPSAPDAPVLPRKGLTFALGGAVGLILGLLVTFGLHGWRRWQQSGGRQ